ncbi:MAG: sensor histidine kinase [Stygiobacter sp.]
MEDFIQANKLLLLGKLTASLVHEIRNPLSAIKLNLDYMNLAKDDLPQDIQDIVKESLEAFEQVTFLIEDVLDFTRRPTSKMHDVNIEQLTDRCIKIISINARMKGITILKEIANNLPVLHLNKNKTMQIFLNLINNAVDASKDKDKIIIRSFKLQNDDSILWQVQDFGCGIKGEDKEKILNGFHTTKSNGHGIGLSVCKKIAEELNSELSFDSKENEGTIFSVKFFIK